MASEEKAKRKQSWPRFVVGLIFAHLLGLVIAAIFSWSFTSKGASAPRSFRPAHAPPALGTVTAHCPRCGAELGRGHLVCPRCGWGAAPPIQPIGQPVAWTPNVEREAPSPVAGAPSLGAGGLPSPREQNAAGKEFIEGHWLGLEVIPLTPELAKEYQIPEGERGVLVDEITLEAAESGILAGDMVHAIGGQPTPDLAQFLAATLRVRTTQQADVEVGRRGKTLVFTISARNTPELGFAQMEAAQPIQPGALSPHRARGKACTGCHVIMETGGQLPTDAGDIVAKPPPIRRGAVAPHRYRGTCTACHQLAR